MNLYFQCFSFYLFFFIKNKDLASCAGDTTSCKAGISAYDIQNLEVIEKTLLSWFNNSMKASPGTYHLLLSGNNSCKIIIENKTISSSK